MEILDAITVILSDTCAASCTAVEIYSQCGSSKIPWLFHRLMFLASNSLVLGYGNWPYSLTLDGSVDLEHRTMV